MFLSSGRRALKSLPRDFNPAPDFFDLTDGEYAGKDVGTVGNLATSRIKKIILLHAEVESDVKTMLDKAIRIGELLTEQKASLEHGEWIPWVEGNLPFGRVEAWRYMRIFGKQEDLNVSSVKHLPVGDLVDFIATPAPELDEDEGDWENGDEEVIVEDEQEDDEIKQVAPCTEICTGSDAEPESVDSDVLGEIAADAKELKAICRAADDIRKRTTALVKKKGLVSAWLWPQILKQYLQNFSKEIKKAIPHALCPMCGGKRCDQCNHTGYVGKTVYGKLIKENENE